MFTYDTAEDIRNKREFKTKVVTHTFERMAGVNEEQQAVPSLKEVEAWRSEMVTKTNSMYFELIPEKPDNKETIMYALSRLEELFITKLGYKYMLVSGDGVTVNILYQIKDEYGAAMNWLLPMLGTWHTLKDYLTIFLKKYKHAFIQPLLKCINFSQNTIDSIIKASDWTRSHNFTNWIMEAVLIMFVKSYSSLNHTETEKVYLKELQTKIKEGIRIINEEEIITTEVATKFAQIHTQSCELLSKLYDSITTYGTVNSQTDDTFALFHNSIEDFMVYQMAYIAIRSHDWSLRITSFKMMAARFVVSGATLYQWLILRHLADVGTIYPNYVLEFLKSGGWVSALRDGKMVSLARDEFHERTASKDIQLVMPRNQTKANMEVVCHYLPYSACIRKSLLEEILGKSNHSFIPKGCGKKFINQQQFFIQKFVSKLEQCDPFISNERKLVKPFTTVFAKPNIRDDMVNSEELGKQWVMAYVSPRFCMRSHTTLSEKSRMKKKILSVFQSGEEKKKKPNPSKEQNKILEVMAAALIKLKDSTDESPIQNLAGSQLNPLPLVLCETDGKTYVKGSKTGVRDFVEKKYPDAFTTKVYGSTPDYNYRPCAFLRDAMQDIFLQPKAGVLTFIDYFKLFWDVKVKPSYLKSNIVCFLFDLQERDISPKDETRENRDEKTSNPCSDIEVSDSTKIPENNSWQEFLANRNNKKNLVFYLVDKMKGSSFLLQSYHRLIVCSEKLVWQVARSDIDPCLLGSMNNNHEESDTLIFFIIKALDLPTYLVRSTDSDVLFIALLNHDKLGDKVIDIEYHVLGSAPKYVSCTTLLQLIQQDTHPTISLLNTQGKSVAKLFAILHFISGCDYLSYTRGLSKNDVWKKSTLFTIFLKSLS